MHGFYKEKWLVRTVFYSYSNVIQQIACNVTEKKIDITLKIVVSLPKLII
jgi:hypothetical protein